MEYKYISWVIVLVGLLLNLFGLFWFTTIFLGLLSFLLGFLSILYLQHGDLDEFLNSGPQENPLQEPKTLGLNLVCDQKPILLISPNIKIQTESKKYKTVQDNRKKSFIDSGFELLFKKHSKQLKDGQHFHRPFRTDAVLDNKDDHHNHHQQHHQEEKKWKPFENIKIYTERKRSHDSSHHHDVKKHEDNSVHFAEEASPHKNQNPPSGNDSRYGNSAEASPRKSTSKTILSGNKQIDQLLHTLIDYILRDFINSWFCSLSDNREFSDFRARNCIEECVTNICNRIKSTQWLPLITTKLVDDVATHTKLYRLAQQSVNIATNNENESKKKVTDKLSPQRKSKARQHRRNKSDTDLNWHLGNNIASQKNLSNSKFYTNQIDEKTLLDPELKLLNAFFDHCNTYREECLDENELENYLTHVMETILYFTLPEEDFACLPLRTFLGTLLANVVFKPLLDMLSDPDFINLQVARLLIKDPPPGEFLIKMIRQCTDLSELRACRQLITKEMDLKYKDSNFSAELASLRYTQKLIDLRISHLQNNKSAVHKSDKDRTASNLPIISLDNILTKELALSYYLDYLSILNLQKYVIFYLTAQEWKLTSSQTISDFQMNKSKGTKEDMMKMLREKAFNIYKEYLVPPSSNLLTIDAGLVEVLSIKIKDSMLPPENTWFDSICKFVYEKLKNEDIFLNNFYQSSAYKKLLLELDVLHHSNEPIDVDLHLGHLNLNLESGSDNNSSDIQFDDDELLHEEQLADHSIKTSGEKEIQKIDTNPDIKITAINGSDKDIIGTSYDLSVLPFLNTKTSLMDDSTNFKHARSHSDCTGILQAFPDLGAGVTKDNIFQINNASGKKEDSSLQRHQLNAAVSQQKPKNTDASGPSSLQLESQHFNPQDIEIHQHRGPMQRRISVTETAEIKRKTTAKIINTAIHCEGQYAVYAIHVCVIEDNQHKSWHIYRRYSKFLELKKILVKRFPGLSKLPFPAKKAFQNTQRSVLEHRMAILNEFLREVCMKAIENDDINVIIRDFLEPDTNDKQIHGGSVIKTIESLVNPLKTGMRTIRNMPDTLVGGISRLFLGKGPMKEVSYLGVGSIQLESSDYPALTSALNLLDEVFDLQTRSQWLRRGIINRLLGAPWVSHTANKKIIHAAKTWTEIDKIEQLLTAILNSIWPDGKREKRNIPREDNTKLRTRMAAKISLFALLSDDLKHVVGSETTRSGLLNLFSMWQHKKLNLRLVLILMNDILTLLYQTDNMTKHVNV